jgi:hypothetical protein
MSHCIQQTCFHVACTNTSHTSAEHPTEQKGAATIKQSKTIQKPYNIINFFIKTAAANVTITNNQIQIQIPAAVKIQIPIPIPIQNPIPIPMNKFKIPIQIQIKFQIQPNSKFKFKFKFKFQKIPEIPEIPRNQNHLLIHHNHHLLSSSVLLLCRVAVTLPCLPVILFCRFCCAVLRVASRFTIRLITCIVATCTFPIRTAIWACKWMTCAYNEYDYYASGAPVVSCAVRAAMSGRRQTRPPAILGENDNCKCNACVWRRAHEAKLPPGKQTAPIRRRPTPVGPRRTRRFLRFVLAFLTPHSFNASAYDSTAATTRCIIIR